LFIQEAWMLLRTIFAAAAIIATALAWSGASVADETRPDRYQGDELLGLDLSKAVLSPKPLGPATSFTPGPLDVTVSPADNRAHADAKPVAAPRVNSATVARSARTAHIADRRPALPRLLARTKFVHHHGNPLDAQAFDARVQVWPCKSGGICNWKQ
jgi:hypothetical protein